MTINVPVVAGHPVPQLSINQSIPEKIVKSDQPDASLLVFHPSNYLNPTDKTQSGINYVFYVCFTVVGFTLYHYAKQGVQIMNMKFILTIATALMIASCSSTQNSNPVQETVKNSDYSATDLVNVEEFPDWFQNNMLRETKIKHKTLLEIEQFRVSKEVMGKVELIKKEAGWWYYNIHIGTTSPVECYVFAQYDGPANSLYAIVEASLTGAEEIYSKPLSGQFNYAVGTGMTESTPYLLLDTLYHLGHGEQKVTGVLKGLSAETNDSLQICLHNEIGYRETFFSTFASFVDAFSESAEKPPFFEAVYKMTFDNIPVGYGREKYTKDDEGDIYIQTSTAFIIPVDARSVSRSDSVGESWSYPDGALINGTVYTIENSTLLSNYSINYQDEKWLVQGELQGKAIKHELEYSGWLLSDFALYNETAVLLASELDSAEFYDWMPEIDPTSALKVIIRKVADNPDENIHIEMGPIVLKTLVEDNGVPKKTYIEQGGKKTYLAPVYLSGEPKLP